MMALAISVLNSTAPLLGVMVARCACTPSLLVAKMEISLGCSSSCSGVLVVSMMVESGWNYTTCRQGEYWLMTDGLVDAPQATGPNTRVTRRVYYYVGPTECGWTNQCASVRFSCAELMRVAGSISCTLLLSDPHQTSNQKLRTAMQV